MERFVSGLVFPDQVEFPEGLKCEVERVATSLTEKCLTTPLEDPANWATPHLNELVQLLLAVNAWLVQIPVDQKPKLRQEWMGWEPVLLPHLSRQEAEKFVIAVVEMGVAMGNWEVISGMRFKEPIFPINMEEELGLNLAEIVARMMVAVRISGKGEEGKVHLEKIVIEITQHSRKMLLLTKELMELVFQTFKRKVIDIDIDIVQEDRAEWNGCGGGLTEWVLTLNRVWLAMVQGTIQERGLQAGLEVLYDRIDNAMLDGNVEEVIQLLQTIHASEVSLEIVMGALTVTVDWRQELPNRGLLAEKAKKMAQELLGQDRAGEVLRGLVA